MASGDAIFPEEAVIFIGAADSSSSSCVEVQGGITNLSESGGEEDSESVPVFGGGNVDLVKPRTQIEVSFDVILKYQTQASTLLQWDDYKWGNFAATKVTSAGSGVGKAIYITFTDGTLFYTRAYNNAKGVTFEPESSADDMLRGTMTFKLSPTDADGIANLQVLSTHASTVVWA